ncbi:YqzL family protein [Wukongibacter sp. M2B1]
MAQLFWEIFMLTGNLDAYLLYKQVMAC